MAFVWRDQIRDGKTTLAQRDHDLIRLALVNTHMVRTMHDQQRGLDPGGGIALDAEPSEITWNAVEIASAATTPTTSSTARASGGRGAGITRVCRHIPS